jgi:xanthine dehydrogenase accessory factor
MKLNPMSWSKAADFLNARGDAYVLVTILGVRGSTPRDSGTKMVVTVDETFDTIGGGHLEFKAIQLAQQQLLDQTNSQHIEHFSLGPNLGQCCGGSTSVLFESFSATHTNLMVFGAGHVAHALMPILAGLPVQVKWVDSRAELFPEHVNNNIEQVVSAFPVDEISNMPSNSYFLVMTHNHQLDFELCETLLKRNDFAYLGLIGSDTKWQRFKQRFDFKGISEERVARMSCPVGLSNVPGKKPMEVAVSMAGEIIQTYQLEQPTKPTQQGIHWKELKTMLEQNNSDNESKQITDVTHGAFTK